MSSRSLFSTDSDSVQNCFGFIQRQSIFIKIISTAWHPTTDLSWNLQNKIAGWDFGPSYLLLWKSHQNCSTTARVWLGIINKMRMLKLDPRLSFWSGGVNRFRSTDSVTRDEVAVKANIPSSLYQLTNDGNYVIGAFYVNPGSPICHKWNIAKLHSREGLDLAATIQQMALILGGNY
jgi:hypothetical protein